MSVRVGLPVPDVEFDVYERGAGGPRTTSLSRLRGRWIVLFFYPRDFTFICPTEIAAFARLSPDFAREGGVIVGASTDSYFSHKAWFETDARLAEVDYPVAADTAHHLSAAFGVLLEDGATLRGTFIVDPEGVLRHMSVNEHDVGRSVEETLRVLQALQTGELCPASWQPGQQTLTTYDEYFARAFPRLTPKLLAAATEQSRTVRVPAGETIIKQGEAADRMFVLRNGEVEILRHSDGQEPAVIATLGPGDHFGEIGLLTESKRTASVRARADTELLELPWEAFRALMESSDEMREEVTGIAGMRMAAVNAGAPTEPAQT